jgi:acetyl esterase
MANSIENSPDAGARKFEDRGVARGDSTLSANEMLVALDPQVQALLDMSASWNPLSDMPIADIRDLMQQHMDTAVDEPWRLKMREVKAVDDHSIFVEGGEIVVRVYTPFGEGPHPAFIHFHGGGFMVGSIDWRFIDLTCREICDRAHCVVANVDYRLAPEFKFPTAPEDCYSGLLWTVENADLLAVDPDRIAIGGGSAGANLAAAVALMARDRQGPRLIFQLLEVPYLDSTEPNRFGSAVQFAHGYGLDADVFTAIAGVYFTDPDDAYHPYASPLQAADLSQLPPAHVMTAEFDVLRDSGEEYGRRLQAAGVRTTVHRHAGHTHGSSALREVWEPARAWFDEVIDVLRCAFSSHRVP